MSKVRLGDYVRIKTGKLDANAASPDGDYPFFTCAVEPLKIDKYSYDCECVLVAGNGDLNVKYYNGKFDAYQRTYIIESIDKTHLCVPYLYRFLDNYIDTLRSQSIGGVIKYIKLGNLTEAPIYIPSIETQNKTVKLLSFLDSLIEKAYQQNKKLDELVKSRFVEMFGDITQSELYPYKRVQDFTTIVSGGTPNRDNDEYWKDGNIPWVKTTELQHSEIENTEECITEKGLTESSAKIVPPGTVLIAMYGQGKTRGMTGLLKIAASTNQACACILPCNEINFIYLWKFFELSYNNLRDLAKGGNQPNLNSALIKNYPVLFPPKNKQNKFADLVTKVDQQKSTVQKSIDKLETLKKSLMQEYFG